MTRSSRRLSLVPLFLLGMAGVALLLPFGNRTPMPVAVPAPPSLVTEPAAPGPIDPARAPVAPAPAPVAPVANPNSGPVRPPLDRSTLPPGLDLDSLALLEGIANSLSEPIFTSPLESKE